MMKILREDHPQVYNIATDFFENNGFYSPCNMFIMRRNILQEFCDWLFPILFHVNDMIGEINDPYQNRYPGFLSERLMSFFFYHFRDKYRVIWSDKNFLN